MGRVKYQIDVFAKLLVFSELGEMTASGPHLANGLQFIKAIHDFGFPGWPELNLDWVSVIGGSDHYRGLAPAPFFISPYL